MLTHTWHMLGGSTFVLPALHQYSGLRNRGYKPRRDTRRSLLPVTQQFQGLSLAFAVKNGLWISQKTRRKSSCFWFSWNSGEKTSRSHWIFSSLATKIRWKWRVCKEGIIKKVYVLFHSPYLLLLYFDPMKIVIVVLDGNRTFLIPSVIQKNGESYYLNVVWNIDFSLRRIKKCFGDMCLYKEVCHCFGCKYGIRTTMWWYFKLTGKLEILVTNLFWSCR